MTRQLIIGLIVEGTTDFRFLSSVVRRTFEVLAFECIEDIEILGIQRITVPNDIFKNTVLQASIYGYENLGISVLCIHTDADAKTDKNAFINKINPGVRAIKEYQGKNCKVCVPIIPITMTESWMIADSEILKEELCTQLSFRQMGINKKVEIIRNPKEKLKEAIRLIYKNNRRKNTPKISDLYLPIGQKIRIQELLNLSSYSKFYNSARSALIELNLINSS